MARHDPTDVALTAQTQCSGATEDSTQTTS
ncbi:hypothetical protein SAMN05444521_8240 [Streptomyces sp. 3214.6]|nr:hypothetical protein SAMN05444521_8240 [Streptomyces sp. 3214.6]